MPSKIELEVELKDVRMACQSSAARHRLIVEDANAELIPMREKKDLLKARIDALKAATDDELKEQGYSGRQEADKVRRELEEKYQTLRVELATREAYWREEAAVWEEKNKADNDRKKELVAKIANFKEPEPAKDVPQAA